MLQWPCPRCSSTNIMMEPILYGLRCAPRATTWAYVLPGRLLRRQDDSSSFLQQSTTFLQVRQVFSKSLPTACTYRSEPHSSRLEYATALFGLFVVQQLLMKVSCVFVHARCSASHETGPYTLSLFEIRGTLGGGQCNPVPLALDSPITTIIKGTT